MIKSISLEYTNNKMEIFFTNIPDSVRKKYVEELFWAGKCSEANNVKFRVTILEDFSQLIHIEGVYHPKVIKEINSKLCLLNHDLHIAKDECIMGSYVEMDL